MVTPKKVKISKKTKSFEWCLFFLGLKGGAGGARGQQSCVRLQRKELFDDEKLGGGTVEPEKVMECAQV